MKKKYPKHIFFAQEWIFTASVFTQPPPFICLINEQNIFWKISLGLFYHYHNHHHHHHHNHAILCAGSLNGVWDGDWLRQNIQKGSLPLFPNVIHQSFIIYNVGQKQKCKATCGKIYKKASASESPCHDNCFFSQALEFDPYDGKFIPPEKRGTDKDFFRGAFVKCFIRCYQWQWNMIPIRYDANGN